MTFSQAIEQVEFRAARISVARDGSRMGPLQVLAMAAKEFPEAAQRLWDEMAEQTITADDYALRWGVLLEEFEKVLFVQRVERQLKNLLS